MKIAQEVEKRVKRLKYGKVYDYSLFDDISNRNALYVTLSRLAANGVIKRFSKGKFYKNKATITEFMGDKYKIDTIISENEKWRQIIGDSGVLLGPRLYNEIGITNQNAFVSDVGKYRTHKRRVIIDGSKIEYVSIPVRVTQDNKEILQLIDVVSNKRCILGLEKNDYVQYVKRKLKKFSVSEISNILEKYRIGVKKSFLDNLLQIDKSATLSIAKRVLKPYEREKYETTYK